jgi:hypothetical protein
MYANFPDQFFNPVEPFQMDPFIYTAGSYLFHHGTDRSADPGIYPGGTAAEQSYSSVKQMAAQ